MFKQLNDTKCEILSFEQRHNVRLIMREDRETRMYVKSAEDSAVDMVAQYNKLDVRIADLAMMNSDAVKYFDEYMVQ